MEQFYKCDFHVHSYNDKGISNTGNNIKELSNNINISNIDCFAITDHNIFPADFFNELSKQIIEDKVLFPGIELNMTISEQEINDHNLTVNEDNYFHAIILFSPKDDFKKIQKIFYEKFKNADDILTDNYDWKKYSKENGNKVITTEELSEELKDFEYIFIPHEGKGSRNISDYLKNMSLENQEYKSRLFYYNSVGLDGSPNKNKNLQIKLSKKILKDIPAFCFSDRKTFGSEWTWIQFDKTFDGLLTAITDPNERIIPFTRISNNPQENYSNHISKITFEQKGDKTEVLLHPGYNAVIGTRGSGKSTLAQILKGENSSLQQRGIKNINYYNRENLKIIKTNQIAYFEQGKFSQFFSDSTIKSPNQIKYLKDKEDVLVKRLGEENKKTLEQIELEEKKIKEIYEKYSSEEDSISRTRKLNNSFKWSKKQKSILNNINLNINSEKHENNKEKMDSISIGLSGIEEIVKELNVDYEEELSEYGDREYIKNEIESLKDSFIKMKDIVTNITKYFSDISIKSEIRNEMIQSFEESVKSILRNHTTEEQAAKEYKDSKVNHYVDTIKFRISIEKKINDLQETISYNKAKEVTEEFEVKKTKYKIKIGRTIPETLEAILELYGYRTGSQDIIKDLSNDLTFLNHNEFISKFNNNRFRKDQLLDKKQLLDYIFQIIKKEMRIENLSINLEKNGKEFSALSPGQRVDALLDVVFEKDIIENNYDLIIFDQPEDNLDVETVKTKLIEKVRTMKLTKQIVIVSHSAPLVVNGDANNIIVCECENGKFIYKNGGFCEEIMRKEVVKILDGGEKYMKERFSKYAFQYSGGEINGN